MPDAVKPTFRLPFDLSRGVVESSVLTSLLTCQGGNLNVLRVAAKVAPFLMDTILAAVAPEIQGAFTRRLRLSHRTRPG